MNNPQRPPLIAVVGSGIYNEHQAELAYEVGRLLAEAGALLVCGGLGGVMEAACRGAREAGGQTIGILPGADVRLANPYVTIPIATGAGEARNVIIIQTAAAVVAIGGEYGTLSEIALARKRDKLVVGLESWDLGEELNGTARIVPVSSPAEAVRLALVAARQA